MMTYIIKDEYISDFIIFKYVILFYSFHIQKVCSKLESKNKSYSV